MDNIGKVFLAGKGFVVDLKEHFSDEKIKEIFAKIKNTKSEHAKQLYLTELFSKIPEASKKTLGYCQKKQVHVSYPECTQCSKELGFKNIPEWEACISAHIRR